MCVCCPALRPRSRQPVKRYKKLTADIFPKSPNGQANERKFLKLCEYAAKNPVRIPKITKYLEERFHKELRYGHYKVIGIIMEAYNKLLSLCGKQMTYFAISLLTLSDELLDCSKQVSVQIVGCRTLNQFISCQTDGTYAHNIGNFVRKLCMLARETGEEHEKRSLRASCLQCLSAMVWYMVEFSYIFNDIDEIVKAMLDSYDGGPHNEEHPEQRHLWLDEVVRGSGGAGAGVPSLCSVYVRPPPERKNSSSLTREEIENPKIWAQICLQRMSELAKERTPARHILEPMFVYFDTNRHWLQPQGLAVIVLCDMCFFMEAPEKQQLVLLNGVIRHLDHKNVTHDPTLKSCIVQVAGTLARQIRSETTLADVGCVVDLLSHLRKSLQATAGSIAEEDVNVNIHLQNSIESCLLEIAKGTHDASRLFDLMVIALEKVAPAGLVARATLSSVLILAHVIAAVYSNLQQAFPEALLLQLLKAMLHPDTESRLMAHQIFAILLFPCSWKSYETRTWKPNSRSTSDSVTALLEKLQKEKAPKGRSLHGGSSLDDFKGKDFSEDDHKQGFTRRNSPNFYKLSTIIDRSCSSNIISEEPCVMKLCEDQILQLLSGFWIQANLSDNSPSNFEAIAHSYCLTLISSHMKTGNQNLILRFFQLPLSLRNVSLYSNFGVLPSTCRRSVYITSTAMLMFAVRMYHIPELNDILKSQAPYDADPYLAINDDLQVYIKPHADPRQYGSAVDNQAATSFFSELQDKHYESEKIVLDIIVRHLNCIVKIEEEEVLNQLSAVFSPDEAFMFAPKELRDLDFNHLIGHLKESPSIDGNLSVSSAAEDDVTSLFSAMNISGQKEANSHCEIMSIGQLLETALEVAGQVVGTSVSTSPLPYNTMASHCEALEASTRMKLSNWLSQENLSTGNGFELPGEGQALIQEGSFHGDSMHSDTGSRDQASTLRLPPASPFDNFLRALSGPQPVFAGLSS